MEILTNNSPDVTDAQPKKLTKNERKIKDAIDQIKREASMKHAHLAESFFRYLTSCEDPEGPEVQQKLAQINGQWRLYVHRKRLNPVAASLLQAECEGLIKEYTELKAVKGLPVQPEAQPEPAN
jgi:hypothetical protein